MTFTLELELDRGEHLPIEQRWDYLLVDLDITFSLENDGIGDYEFWGATYFDSQSYYVIDKITWDHTLYDNATNELIEDYLDVNYKYIESHTCEIAWQRHHDAKLEKDLRRTL